MSGDSTVGPKEFRRIALGLDGAVEGTIDCISGLTR